MTVATIKDPSTTMIQTGAPAMNAPHARTAEMTRAVTFLRDAGLHAPGVTTLGL